MKKPNQQQQQQYQRFTEIFDLGQQRYFKAVGNVKGYRAGVRGQDYLTDEERNEVKALLRQIFEIKRSEFSGRKLNR
jgi:hypothetical protein